MTKGSTELHNKIQNEVMLAVGALPYCRIWKRVVGLFYRVRHDKIGRVIEAVPIYVGVKGEGDLDGILCRWDGVGVRFHFEIKSGNAKQTDEQKNFQRMIQAMGGIYEVVRSKDEALRIIELERVRGQR